MICYFITAKTIDDSDKVEAAHFTSCLIETLSDMFGEECILDLHKGEKITLQIDEKIVTINMFDMVSVEIYVDIIYLCTNIIIY